MSSIQESSLQFPIVDECDLIDAIAKVDDNGDSMKRNRPYDGQEHTFYGTRGSEEIGGVTFRDLFDCYIREVLLAAHHLVPDRYFEAEKGAEAKLSSASMYGFDLDQLDPVAIAQNLCCEVEKVMGIYPNVPGLNQLLDSLHLVRGREYRHKTKGLCKFIYVHPDDGACLIMEEIDREDGEIDNYFSCEKSDLEDVK